MIRSWVASWWFVLSLVAALVPGWGCAAERAAGLTGVQFAAAGDGTRIVLRLTAPARFRAWVAISPYRAEIDIAGVRPVPAAAAGAGFGVVRRFRAEAAGRVTRLTLDLARPATIVAATALPARGRDPARIVVAFAPADPIAMAAASGLVLTPDPPGAFRPTGASDPIRPLAAVPGAARMLLPPRPVAAASVRFVLPLPLLPAAPMPPPRIATAAAPAKLVPIVAPKIQARRTIVIDAGHGGIDPGAESIAGYHEKEITLATARVLRRVLEETGRYSVVLTRDRDVYLKLGQRVAVARAAGGNVFISLHADSVAGGPLVAVAAGGARGASIYTLSETASDAESERYAQEENHADAIGGADLPDAGTDVVGILADLTMRETVGGGNRLAGILVDSFARQNVGLFPRAPHRSAGFAVLKAPDIPSVLIEMGYLSDPDDSRSLASPDYQLRIARAIADGVDRYFDWVEASRS